MQVKISLHAQCVWASEQYDVSLYLGRLEEMGVGQMFLNARRISHDYSEGCLLVGALVGATSATA